MSCLDQVNLLVGEKGDEQLLNNDFMQAPLIFEDKFDKTT